MQSGGLSAFTEAREEIQFWPAAASAYYATRTGSKWPLIAFLLLILFGAIMFKMHQELREVLEAEINKAGVRNRNSREELSRFEVILEGGKKFWESRQPQNAVSRNIVILGMVSNFVGGIALFIWLVLRVLGEPAPTVPGLGLVALPLLMLAVVVSSYLWNS